MPTTGWMISEPLTCCGGALGQFFVDAVQRVAGLEGDHVVVAHLFEHGAHLGRRAAQFDKVVVLRQVDDLERAGDADLAPARHFGDHRVLGVGRAIRQGGFGLGVPVDRPRPAS